VADREEAMKIGLIGDTHYTNRSPINRIDDYWATLVRKTEQALTIFDDNNCRCILQTGDFCNTPTVANRVISSLIGFYSHLTVYSIAGQHDLSGHSMSTLPNSPLAILEAAEIITIANNKRIALGYVGDSDTTSVVLYGASFGEEVPEVENKDHFNILIIHKMIGNRDLYPGQELINPKRFLRKYPDYNLVVAGDYHYRFEAELDGRVIINPGVLIRKTISKFDLEHKPAVVVFDTETTKSEIFELDIESADTVFNTKRTVKKDSSILLHLIDGLRNRNENTLGWKQILLKIFEERVTRQSVRDRIDECLEKVKK
jgi:predicted phosphodiesterase